MQILPREKLDVLLERGFRISPSRILVGAGTVARERWVTVAALILLGGLVNAAGTLAAQEVRPLVEGLSALILSLGSMAALFHPWSRPLGADIQGRLMRVLGAFLVSLLASALTLVGLFLLVLPGAFLLVAFFWAMPFYLDGVSSDPRHALRLSYRLARRSFWPVAGFVAAVLLFSEIPTALEWLLQAYLPSDGARLWDSFLWGGMAWSFELASTLVVVATLRDFAVQAGS